VWTELCFNQQTGYRISEKTQKEIQKLRCIFRGRATKTHERDSIVSRGKHPVSVLHATSIHASDAMLLQPLERITTKDVCLTYVLSLLKGIRAAIMGKRFGTTSER
jgi:hypothetical protein